MPLSCRVARSVVVIPSGWSRSGPRLSASGPQRPDLLARVPTHETIALLAREVPVTEIPRADLEAGIGLMDLMIRTRLAEGKGAARKLMEGGGVYLNNERQIQVQNGGHGD